MNTAASTLPARDARSNADDRNPAAPGPDARGLIPITDEEFDRARILVYRNFGIHLAVEKKSLVMGRLQKTLKSGGFRTFADYLDHLEQDPSPAALSALADRISTNHTFFFREPDHFEFLRTVVLPEVEADLARTGGNDLRLWCAAAATGEEPYSLAMVLLETFGARYARFNAGLLATDISDKALTAARAGIYPDDRVDKVPPEWKAKHLRRTRTGDWAVSDRLKQEVLFRRFNLMNERFPFKSPFHVIFCRNVMIYFDPPTRDRLVQRLYEATLPGGYLFIGHSETLGRGRTAYDYVRPAVYRRPTDRVTGGPKAGNEWGLGKP